MIYLFSNVLIKKWIDIETISGKARHWLSFRDLVCVSFAFLDEKKAACLLFSLSRMSQYHEKDTDIYCKDEKLGFQLFGTEISERPYCFT